MTGTETALTQAAPEQEPQYPGEHGGATLGGLPTFPPTAMPWHVPARG
jgi:hypothetical protein